MEKTKKDRFVVRYLFAGFIFMMAIVVSQYTYEFLGRYAYIKYNRYIINKALESDIDLFQRGIEHDIPQAMYGLGHMYYMGDTYEIDLIKAREWYQKAAERGEKLSQFWLGFMYHNGIGVEVDLGKAIYYYKLSANQGCNLALSELSMMYRQGKGVDKDLDKAEELFRKSSTTFGTSVSYKRQIKKIIKYQLGEF